MISEHDFTCPYCGEAVSTTVDLSAGNQDYIEDCPVCCKPIECRLRLLPDNDFEFSVRRDDE